MKALQPSLFLQPGRVHRSIPALLALVLIAGSQAQAATLTLSMQPITDGYQLTATGEVGTYLILQSSTDLTTFYPVQMETVTPQGSVGFAILAPRDIATGQLRQFFKVRPVSVYAPEDTDGDLLDDLYEIQHPFLNPLNAADAALIVPGKAISYLQEYRDIYGFSSDPPRVYSREVSTFNSGRPMEAALSREVSVFSSGGMSAIHSREVSIFNFSVERFDLKAISREVSVRNDIAP